MIRKHSDDPDVELAAQQAFEIVRKILAESPKAGTFDYGGHDLRIGEYEVCTRCTAPIAEAQQAEKALTQKADETDDAEIKEHLQLAAQLFRLEAEAAVVRAEFHNGHGTEKSSTRYSASSTNAASTTIITIATTRGIKL